ncbi:MAG: ABC transporter permease [Alphaproteobacteria bacterium]|nr:ABC transporter permease [Alphaproteobacteria bacterium]
MVWMQLVATRLTQAVAMALVLATLCFGFVQALPGDLATRIAAARVGEARLTPEIATRIRAQAGLDQPVLVQYGGWLADLARGELGRSLVTGEPVVAEFRYHAGHTLVLGLLGWALSYLIALPIGLWAGLRPGGWVDRISDAAAVLLASLPPFLTGIALISLFALTLTWLPPAGFGTWAHRVLPALTLALGLAAFAVPVIRTAVVEVRGAFYLTYAQIKGLGETAAFRHHGLRNAAIPIVTYAALQMTFVIDGFVVIETLFNHPGLGAWLVKALLARDVPVILAASLAIGFLFSLVSLITDALCLALDPRARAASVRLGRGWSAR